MTHNKDPAGRNTAWFARIVEQEMFLEVPRGRLEALLDSCGIHHLAHEELLLSPGEKSDYLYILLEGQLGVYLEKPEGEPDFPVGPGEYVGEISIIDRRPATAFVMATEPSVVLAIPESGFWHDFLGDPRIAMNFLQLFANRFRSRNRSMQRTLEERLRYEHLEKELGIAQEIQVGMLPSNLNLRPEIDIVASMVPARHVGGDFYDVFPLGGDELCIAIGDVSGKGVPASLFMVKAMTLLRTEMLRRESLESAAQRINQALCMENDRYMFVTMIIGVLDCASGTFRYACAGHNPAVVGEQGKHFRFLPSPDGLVAGVSEDAAYDSARIILSAGDVLVLYTDGISEAMNAHHELFGDERLLGSLESNTTATAAAAAARVDAAVASFVDGAPPSDDVTLVVLRYLGR